MFILGLNVSELRVGLAGFGTVGQGVYRLLQSNAQSIEQRLGISVRVSRIASRRPKPECPTGDLPFDHDVMSLVDAADVDVLVELIGGVDKALELVLASIEAGKPVVTANKALIAEHGEEILSKAAVKGVPVLFEASVAGGIPILKTLREGLAGNQISKVAGIINGTSNYIVSEMLAGRQFDEVLTEAQRLGYAEADPSFDVGGKDAAHKITLLASIAFGIPLSFDAVHIEGVTELEPIDFACADLFGYRIKHLGIAAMQGDQVSIRVHPALLPKSELLSQVNGVMNAVSVHGNGVGPCLSYGPGAGSLPTASSVVADIMDLARSSMSETHAAAPLGFSQLDDRLSVMPIEAIETAYYLRVRVPNQSGVLADIAQQLSRRGVNIESILQRTEWVENNQVPVVIVTQQALEKTINEAIGEIEQLTGAQVMKIRIESNGPGVSNPGVSNNND